jgi:hypothetical protein
MSDDGLNYKCGELDGGDCTCSHLVSSFCNATVGICQDSGPLRLF